MESSLCLGLGRRYPGGRCMEAEKRTQSFVEAGVEAQVWREEEAGL